MAEMLFIGGPRDGERLNFEEPVSHHVTMPANPQRRGHEAALFAGYRLGQLAAQDSLEGFYYSDEMTYVDALIALVRGYRPLAALAADTPAVVTPPSDASAGRP